MTEGADVPEWFITEQMQLFRHITVPLGVLMPDVGSEERVLFSRTLFSAVHGVVTIGLEDKLVAVPRQQLDGQIEFFVRLVCDGLVGGQPGHGSVSPAAKAP